MGSSGRPPSSITTCGLGEALKQSQLFRVLCVVSFGGDGDVDVVGAADATDALSWDPFVAQKVGI